VAPPQARRELVQVLQTALPEFSLFECQIPGTVHGDDERYPHTYINIHTRTLIYSPTPYNLPTPHTHPRAASRARLLFAASAGGGPLLPRLPIGTDSLHAEGREGKRLIGIVCRICVDMQSNYVYYCDTCYIYTDIGLGRASSELCRQHLAEELDLLSALSKGEPGNACRLIDEPALWLAGMSHIK
jgi:hypothetical protein